MLTPALHFMGCCKEAIALYQQAFGTEAAYIALYREAPADAGFSAPADKQDYVMHAEMTIAGSRITMCDVLDQNVTGNRVVLCAWLDSDEEVIKVFRALSVGATEITEPAPQFFATMYAVLTDRFGIQWQLINEKPAE